MDEGSTVNGLVRALDGAWATVEVEQVGCGRCHETGGCGGQQLTQVFCNGPRQYRVRNNAGAAVGDRVRIAIAPGRVRRTANLAYGVPLLGLVSGAALGTALAGDGGSMAGGGVGLVAGWLLVRWRALRTTGNSGGAPRIVFRYPN